MKNMNQEPQQERSLEESLSFVGPDQVLQFAPHGVRLYELVETGETQLHSYWDGSSEYVFRIPLREPRLINYGATINEVLEGEPDTAVQDAYDQFHTINDPDYIAWKAALPDPEMLQQTAIDALRQAEQTGKKPAEAMACTNCRGEGYSHSQCTCLRGGATFADLTGEDDELEVTRLRNTGEPDSECEQCLGTGNQFNECACCEGRGKVPMRPLILVENQLTGEQRLLKIDILSLLAAGEVAAEWQSNESIFADGHHVVSQQTLVLRLDRYVQQQLDQMDIDATHTALVTPAGSVRGLDLENFQLRVMRANWVNNYGKITAQTSQLPHSRSTRRNSSLAALPDLLQDLQRNIAAQRSWLQDKITHEGTEIMAEPWQLRPLRPLNEAFDDLQSALWSRGTTLGYILEDLADGNVGPSFYELDNEGHLIDQLSSGLTLRDAIENAWLKIMRGEAA